MPKPQLKNPFARRKSSGNVLDSPTEAPVSSFRVIERPEKSKIVLDAPDRRTSTIPRPFASPLENLRGKSVDDLTYSAGGMVDTAASRRSAGALQKIARGSGGTTGSNSSEFYQSSSSARHSSSSTLPSSVEPEVESDGELFTQKWAAASRKPLPLAPEDPLPMPPSFSARAQRAFSFGLGRKPVSDNNVPTASSPTIAGKPYSSHSPTRERALTTSSYASTAVQPTYEIAKPDLKAADFGDSFGDMFEHMGQPKKETVGISPPAHRTDSPPIFPPKSYARENYTPSPHGLRGMQNEVESPYSLTRRTSRDGLLDSSAANSPHLAKKTSGFFSSSKPEYALVSHDTSPAMSKQSSQEYLSASAGVSTNPSAEDVRRYELRDPQITPVPQLTATDKQSSLKLSPIPQIAPTGQLSDDLEMVDITPKPVNRQSALLEDEPLFDARPANGPRPAPAPAAASQPKRITKAQYEILQKYPNHAAEAADKDDSGDEYDDDDEKEKFKQVAHQRRKQEANMSLYRQQMKKVTGGGPTDLPARPSMDRAGSSAPSLHLGGIPPTPPTDLYRPKVTNNDDDDDDVPLAILQAHGFPSNTRAPSQAMDATPSYKGASMGRASTALPPFARRLPEDPYFGAGIVNPAARESLAFGNGNFGPPSQPGTPGGLVGIIATEERQRQARRGSPNPVTGTYPNMPLPANMPGMNRASSMPSVQMPMQPGMPGMPMMMPQMPGADNAQLQQFMHAQMAMMQNMQNMIQMQQAQINGQMPPQPQMQPGLPRPGSVMSNIPSVQGNANQGRTMSMMGTPNTWNLGAAQPRPVTSFDPRMSTYAPSVNGLGPAAGYTPSIAPSERSNVGQPSRYRPVTAGNDGRTNSLTSSQTLNAFRSSQGVSSPLERPGSQQTQRPQSTIRIVEKPRGAPRSANVENDDDDEGNWADMVKKRLKGKRGDRANKNAEDRVALSELYPNVE